MWNINSTTTLIKLWEQNPILYHAEHPGYHNKTQRNKALEQIRTNLNEIGYIVTLPQITNKIHGLRTQYLAHKKRVNKSITNGTEDVYVPKLWSYELLKFLDGAVKIDLNSTPSYDYSNESEYLVPKKEDCTEEAEFEDDTSKNVPSSSCTPKKKRMVDELLGSSTESFSFKEDDDDHIDQFAKLISSEMRLIHNPKKVKLMKKQILDILYRDDDDE